MHYKIKKDFFCEIFFAGCNLHSECKIFVNFTFQFNVYCNKYKLNNHSKSVFFFFVKIKLEDKKLYISAKNLQSLKQLNNYRKK